MLLADEVTSELDAANRQRVIDLLRAEATRGAAVVFATHDPEAAAACDRELHLPRRPGRPGPAEPATSPCTGPVAAVAADQAAVSLPGTRVTSPSTCSTVNRVPGG